MKTKMELYTQDQVRSIAQRLCALMPRMRIFTFQGPLGAGKTTLIQTMLAELGVAEEITSPTFGYVNTYQAKKWQVHHFDLYRLSSLNEFLELGFEEYLAQPDALILIEWPEIVLPWLEATLLASQTCQVRLYYRSADPALRGIELTLPPDFTGWR